MGGGGRDSLSAREACVSSVDGLVFLACRKRRDRFSTATVGLSIGSVSMASFMCVLWSERVSG